MASPPTAPTGATSDDRSRALTPKGIKENPEGGGRLEKTRRSLLIESSAVRWSARARRQKSSPRRCSWRTAWRNSSSSVPTNRSATCCLAWLPTRAKKQILLVGHEPLLSSTVSFLLSGKAGAQIQLKKGGLCCLEVDGVPPRKSAVLQWALAPKHLRLLAR